MNRTKTTSTTRRRSLRHAALALVALVALVAASCTADPLDGRDTPNAGNGTNPDDVLTFAVAPRPGFTEAAATRATDTKAATKAVIPGNSTVIPVLNQVQDDTRDLPNGKAGLSVQEIAGQARNDKKSARNDGGESTAPATRATQTDDGTRWEQGDILWLDVAFFHDKQNIAPDYTSYISALKYDVGEWRYLTQAESEDLNTGSLHNFTRLLRWPHGSADWPAPGIRVFAIYAGSGKPDADRTLTITPKGEIPTTPFIVGNSGICSPDVQPVPLEFRYENTSRVRIPAGCKVELINAEYWSTVEFQLPNGMPQSYNTITEIPAQSEGTDVFLRLGWSGNPTAKLTRNNVSYTFTFPTITDAEGYPTWAGASYALTPYTSGTETPGGYDLTVATETDLRELARAVNAGNRLPNGKPAAEARVLQTANLHLTQGEWVPIGNSLDNPFRGAYNGNGNEITGLTISTAPQPDALNDSYTGLFGRVDGAVLTGIKLRGVKINISMGSDVQLYVGSIAGYIKNSTLSLCSADGTVNASGGDATVDAGGIAGYSVYSTISRCRADVETKAVATKGNGYVYAGGIAGYNDSYSFILSCESGDRAVTAEGQRSTYAGGIAGLSDGATFIAFCRTGKNVVKARNASGWNYAGGLVGHINGYLYSCYSRATAEATGARINRVGAIAGNIYEQNRAQYCYATDATGKGTSNLDAIGNIFYDTDPDAGEIFRVMTGFTGKVESITEGGKTYYPFTTTYDPSATPAYGIIPQRAVWTKDAWKDGGSDPQFPEIDYDYEGK